MSTSQAAEGCGLFEVIPQLYLGEYTASRNVKHLKRKKISFLLGIMNEVVFMEDDLFGVRKRFHTTSHHRCHLVAGGGFNVFEISVFLGHFLFVKEKTKS